MSEGGFAGPRCRAIWRQAGPVLYTTLIAVGVAQAVEIAPTAAPLRHPVLVTQLPAGTSGEQAAPSAGGMLRLAYGEGGRIVRLDPNGTAQVLTASFHSAAEPDVSFDGKRFLFAGKRTAADHWNIYEMAIDGSAVRQITRGLGDCRSPGYQSTQYVITATEPWYQITFVGTGHGWMNEAQAGPATALYSCRLDGSEVKRLTYNLSNDYDPVIMWDGRLLYASWQRATLEHGWRGRIRIFGVNTDGSDYAAYVPDVGRRIQHMPCTTPGGLAVFVECDQALWDGSGTLGVAEIRRPWKTYRRLTTEADGRFHSPAPLPDGSLLVAWRPNDGSRTHGLYRFDLVRKRLEPVFDDPRFHDFHAKAVYAREEPDGRSSVVSEQDPHAKLYCLNVFESDLSARQGFGPGVAKRLRVVEGVPRRAEWPGWKASGGGPGRGDDSPAGAKAQAAHSPLALRRILGEVALEKDGSFTLEVPANTPLELQLLDDDGLAVRRCGWIWARSHQAQGCIGCHEDPELSPENYLTEALRKDAVPLAPPVASRRAVSFRRDLLSVIAAKCAGCHDAAGSPPRLELARLPSGEVTPEAARRVYQALMAADPAAGPENPWGLYVHPGRARTSPLVWHVLGRNTSRPWDGAWSQRPAKPIPPGQVEPLSESERRLWVEWIDLGAAFATPGE